MCTNELTYNLFVIWREVSLTKGQIYYAGAYSSLPVHVDQGCQTQNQSLHFTLSDPQEPEKRIVNL